MTLWTLGSIFNQALGPVTFGPSSSNTSGTNRIGFITRELLGSQPQRVLIEFSSSGAFPATYRGMRSDVAFTDGLNGILYDEVAGEQQTGTASASQFPVDFAIVDEVFSKEIEAARLRVWDADGTEHVILGDSLGAGDISVRRIDSLPIRIDGRSTQILILNAWDLSHDMARALAEQVCALGLEATIHYESTGVLQLRTTKALDLDARQRVGELIRSVVPNATVRFVNAVYPVNQIAEPPFVDTASALAYCANEGISLGEAGFRYEEIVSGWSRDDLENYARRLIRLMRESVRSGLDDESEIFGVIQRHSAKLLESNRRRLDLGFLGRAMAYAHAVMEHSNSYKVIVCAPTGGACAVIPGLLIGYADEFELSDDDLLRPLMAAGLIGVLMTRFDNNFNGTDLGCQMEVGCAVSMAGASLVELLDGTPAQAFDAAAIGMQCNMGILCDPVGGLVQVPCIQRNNAGVGTATTAALMTISGFDPVIGFEESFGAAVQLGKDFPPHMKGSNCGGLCGTGTAQRIKDTLMMPSVPSISLA